MTSEQGAASTTPMMRKPVAHYLTNYGIVWISVLLFLLLAITTPNFLSTDNFRNILDQQSIVLIVAAFVTMVLISGNFDISIGAIYTLVPLLALRMFDASNSVMLFIGVGLVAGLAAGLVNGFVVTKGRINSFIATLGTALIFFGLSYLVTDGTILRLSDLDVRSLVTTRILGLTSSTWIAVAALVIAWILLERTRFGRYLFAIGGNREAARLAGVPVDRIIIIVFALVGVAAGLAGTMNTARTLTAQASDDFSLVFTVIAAVVVGGTSIAGGFGAIWRTVVGVFFIAMLGNGFNLNGIDPVIQRIIEGLVILAAVGLDAWSRSRRAT
ncbi:MAG: ABC transporter permease [Candidatus Nanopelagicales bacterium]